MISEKKVNEEAIIVNNSSYVNKLYVRHKGIQNKHTEKELVKIEGDSVYINKSLLEEFGLNVVLEYEKTDTRFNDDYDDPDYELEGI